MNDKQPRRYQSGREVFETFIPGYVAPQSISDEELFDGIESKSVSELTETLLSALRAEVEKLNLPQQLSKDR